MAALTDSDRLQLAALITRYARCVDTANVSGFIANFTPDATYTTSGGRTSKGHAEIQALFEDIVRRRQGAIRHFVGQPSIEGNAEECEVQSYSLVLIEDADGPRIRSVVEYTDRCAKIDGAWLFTARRNQTVLPTSSY